MSTNTLFKKSGLNVQDMLAKTAKSGRVLLVGEEIGTAWDATCANEGMRVETTVVHAEIREHLRHWSSFPFHAVVICGRHRFKGGSDLVLEFCAIAPRPTLVLVSGELNLETCISAREQGFIALPPPEDLGALRCLVRHLANPAEAASASCAAARSGAADSIVLAPGWSIETQQRLLTTPAGIAYLSSGEADIIRHLAGRRGIWTLAESMSQKLFNRTDRAGRELVWKYISDLRRRLGSQKRLLESRRTRGYRLVEVEGTTAARAGGRDGKVNAAL
jgi:DNA-binding response OmpR family regulator